MIRIFHNIFLFSLLPLVVVASIDLQAAAQEDEQTVEDVIELHIQSLGGREVLEQVETIRTDADVTFPGGEGEITGQLTQVQRGEKFLMAMDLGEFGTLRRGSDGEIFWIIGPQIGPRIQTGDELEEVKSKFTTTFPALTWDEFEGEIILEGTEIVDGKNAHKLVFVSPNNDEVVRFIDVETGLLLKIENYKVTPNGTTILEVYPSDYRQVDGVTIAFSQRTLAPGGALTMTITDLAFGEEYDDDYFSLPPAIAEIHQAMTIEGAMKPRDENEEKDKNE